jgi:hypothetical protein
MAKFKFKVGQRVKAMGQPGKIVARFTHLSPCACYVVELDCKFNCPAHNGGEIYRSVYAEDRVEPEFSNGAVAQRQSGAQRSRAKRQGSEVRVLPAPTFNN